MRLILIVLALVWPLWVSWAFIAGVFALLLAYAVCAMAGREP